MDMKKKMLRIRQFVITAVLMLTTAGVSGAQSQFVDRSTDLLCLAPSVSGLVKSAMEKDKEGFIQLGLSSVTGIALNYGLNVVISKDRPVTGDSPDWSDHHAFPSTHTMAAFDGATFLIRRYGWKWGLPAYAISSYVAWGRVQTGKHDCWDVLGGAAVGACSALIFTRPFAKDMDITIAPAASGRSKGFYMSLRF